MAYKKPHTNIIKKPTVDGRAILRSLAETLDVSVTTVSNLFQELEKLVLFVATRPQ